MVQRWARHEDTQGNEFHNFVLLSIYKLSFFIVITTIGLNLILGIIVDTFSELRDKKVNLHYKQRFIFANNFLCGVPVSQYKIAPSEKSSPADNLLAKIRPARRPPWPDGFLPVNCRLGETFLEGDLIMGRLFGGRQYFNIKSVIISPGWIFHGGYILM